MNSVVFMFNVKIRRFKRRSSNIVLLLFILRWIERVSKYEKYYFCRSFSTISHSVLNRRNWWEIFYYNLFGLKKVVVGNVESRSVNWNGQMIVTKCRYEVSVYLFSVRRSFKMRLAFQNWTNRATQSTNQTDSYI